MLLVCVAAHAFIIEDIDSEEEAYANGDLVEITVYANINTLIVTADFNRLDSKFDERSVIIEYHGYRYDIFYPITFANTKKDDIYNIVISAYDPITDTSSIVSYGIKLDNDLMINRTGGSESIKIQVRERELGDDPRDWPDDITDISVEEGMVKVCRPSGCELITEEEYEAARNIVISSGNVSLSGLTYNQLKGEILKDVTATLDKKLKDYLDLIIDARTQLQQVVGEFKIMMNTSQERFNNQTDRTERMINRATMGYIGLGIMIILIIVAAFFVFYLKTNTTWLS